MQKFSHAGFSRKIVLVNGDSADKYNRNGAFPVSFFFIIRTAFHLPVLGAFSDRRSVFGSFRGDFGRFDLKMCCKGRVCGRVSRIIMTRKIVYNENNPETWRN